ncbi:hypothetical protein [Ekhidna sp.]|uniref:hypothetical protein n=1 Tax=Ekhidna sp. TaxID=2608089 RepID=UPI003CCC1B64
MKNRVKNLLALFIITLLFLSCEEEEGIEACEPPFSNIELDAYSIDGNRLPYTESFGVGNSLTYESITLNVKSDGTWRSTVRSTQTVSGDSKDVTVNQNGTWECGQLSVTLRDDEGDEGAVLSWDFSVGQTSTGPIKNYRIRFDNISSEILFLWDEPLLD